MADGNVILVHAPILDPVASDNCREERHVGENVKNSKIKVPSRKRTVGMEKAGD